MTTRPTDASSDIEAALGGFFRDTWPDDAPPEDAEAFDAEHWSAITELGLTTIGLPEQLGGAGGSLADLVPVLHLAGRHAVPLPIVEAHLAAWLLARSNRSVDVATPLWTIARPDARDHFRLEGEHASGVLHDVPWGDVATSVLVLHETPNGERFTVAVDPSSCDVLVHEDLAGQPAAGLTLDRSMVSVWPTEATHDEFEARGMVLTAALMSGAMTAAADLTRDYVEQREQFGRPIGRFQAVQHHVVELTQMAVMTQSMVDRIALLDAELDAHPLDVASVKLVSNENAAEVTRAAHQAHGAIGMTREYRLHRLTRRLHLWRDVFGRDVELAGRIGRMSATAPSFAGLLLDDMTVRAEAIS